MDTLKRSVKGSILEKPLNKAIKRVRDEAKLKSNGAGKSNGGADGKAKSGLRTPRGSRHTSGKAKQASASRRVAK